jgi:hypothetical protein
VTDHNTFDNPLIFNDNLLTLKAFEQESMKFDTIQPRIAELRASIIRHFPLEPVPSQDEIVSHQCDECWHIRNDFTAQPWKDVTRETIDHHTSALPLFTSLAHHYYLPAYLLRTLEPEGEMWGTVVDFIIYDLCPSTDHPDWWKSRFAVFTIEQKCVVASWLTLYWNIKKCLMATRSSDAADLSSIGKSMLSNDCCS